MTIAKYYELEQKKLFIEFEKISLFTNHNPTIGSYRENVIKDYLRRLVPSQLEISSGFIATYTDNDHDIYQKQSRQIDCLIFDKSHYIPFLETQHFSVIPPQSAYSCIEVKSSLTFYKKKNPEKSKKTSDQFPLGGDYTESYRWEGTLIDALINIKAAVDVCEGMDRIPIMGIVAYSYNFDLDNFYHALDNNELQRQLGLKNLNQLPFSICVPGRFTVVFSHLDMFDPGCVHDEYTSFYNEMNSVEGFEQYPLQFFSVLFHNNINFQLNKKHPDKGGLFTATGSNIRMRSMHFDLSSEGE